MISEADKSVEFVDHNVFANMFAIEDRKLITFRRARPFFDVAVLVSMLRDFVTSTKYRKYVGQSAESLRAFIESLIDNPSAAIFVAEKDAHVIGMLGVLGYVHPMSGEKCAGELFWWLDPNHRGAGGWLLRRAEQWAREYGAGSMQMIAPADNARVAEMYQRLGYEAVETAYHRTLA